MIYISDCTGFFPKATHARINGRMEVNGKTISCSLSLGPWSANSTLFAVEHSDKIWNVVSAKNLSGRSKGAMSVIDIRPLISRPIIAIVDDNPGILTLISKQLEPNFEVTTFLRGKDLLAATNVNMFSGFIIEWKLPDVEGDELIMSLRKISSAPIFVTTGQKEYRHQIAQLIANTDVNYVEKPFDEIILAAQITQAILNTNGGRFDTRAI